MTKSKPEADTIEQILEKFASDVLKDFKKNGDYAYSLELEATSLLQDLLVKERIEELKSIWNETQPDIVPSGWTPETLEAKVIEKRIKELQSKLKESSND